MISTRHVFLTHGELTKLLGCARKCRRAHALILLAYRHGLRASEVTQLQTSDVDLERRMILCRRGKGSITNWQAMADDEVDAVQALLPIGDTKERPYLFGSRQSPFISRSQFFRIFQSLAIAAGIAKEKRHPQVLKHSLGTHLANGGVPVQVIQQRLGHRSIKNTMIYLEIANTPTWMSSASWPGHGERLFSDDVIDATGGAFCCTRSGRCNFGVTME